ncbi:MAG: electron transfer flavoprotein subunit beta/FixA family protein [Nitrososphaeria archaeon]|nr:electron transfer flavoprotein subunit beta/FixA family protein [Conexivisphaerales archaeon]
MRIIVALKPTYDVSQLKFDSEGVPLLDTCPVTLGEADKCALEEALKVKGSLGATVVAVTVGQSEAHIKGIKDALAMGADEGYIIKINNAWNISSITVANAIARFAVVTGPYDIVFTGSGAGDTHSSIIGPMVSALLGYRLVANADKVEVKEQKATAKCTMEDGTYNYEVEFPAVITVTSEANEPRIPTLKAILRSKNMQVKEIGPEQLGLSVEEYKDIKVIKHMVERKRVIMEASDQKSTEESVVKLLTFLKDEGVI